MIPLPPAIKAKILAWLPHVLNGYDYPLKETDNIVPDLIAPAITYYFSSVGTPSQFSAQPLRTVRNIVTGEMEEYWGQYHYATMNVVLRANTKAEMEAMWYEFYARCLSTRRDAKIYHDGWRFLEVLDSKPLAAERLDSGKNLYWAQVDLRFEYEVSSVPDEDFIKRVNSEMQVGESDEHLTWTAEVREVELSAGILALIVSYSLDHGHGHNSGYMMIHW
jgi:hypothetical protein